MNLCLPGLTLAEQLYVSLQANGYGRSGTQALQLSLAAMSNIDWRKRLAWPRHYENRLSLNVSAADAVVAGRFAYDIFKHPLHRFRIEKS